MHTAFARVAVLTLALFTLVACAGTPGKVSKGDVQSVRAAYESLSIGMSKEAVTKALHKGNLVRLGSSSMSGATIEEYKIEAFHDDDWNKSRDLFIGFMYFANDKLVETSSARVDYRANPAMVEQWTAN